MSHSPPARAVRRPLLVAAIAFALAVLGAACAAEDAQPVTTGDRVTLSLAVYDTPGHRAALYAIERRLVTSTTVDPVVTYLSPSVIADAARSRQYDVVETSSLALLGGNADTAPFVLLSAGLLDLDGTLLFVPAGESLSSPQRLAGGAVGVVSLDDPSTLALRYLLQESYGIDAGRQNAGVTIEVAPGDSLPGLLRAGDIDALALTDQAAFRLSTDPEFRVLSHVSQEAAELTGAPVMGSVLVTYPDVVAQNGDALRELNRLLAESLTYFRANQDAVLDALAVEQEVSLEYLRWWWERYDLPLGDLSRATQEQLLQVWDAARALGDTEALPDLATLLFNPDAPIASPTPAPSPTAAEE